MVTFSQEQHNEQQGIVVHYGTPRHSGRYPWGSGDDETSQRNHTLLSTIDDMRKQGLKDTDIAAGLGMTTTQMRDLRTIVRTEQKQDQIHMAQKLKEKGLSNGAIAIRMREAGHKINGESQVRALLNPSQERKSKVLDSVTDSLRKAVDEKHYLDVGSGVEFQLDITSTKLRSALQRLKDEGYVVREVRVEQLTTGKFTNMRVLARPGTDWAEVQKNRTEIKQFTDYSDDGGQTVLGIAPPLSISSKRVGVRYEHQGGTEADGTIYVRPGVKDVSLGKSQYAQVRVQVDDSHYIKGMAVYKDDLPDGVDLLFNTNKKDTGNKLDALKELKKLPDGTVDHDNPFGATISKQIGEGVNPKTLKPLKLTSVMNIVNGEGDWADWSRNISTQVASKQRPSLAREQLDLAYQRKKSEYDAIMRLNNPSVKKKLLDAFSDSADSAAVHLKAAALPRQKTQVILPLPEIKPGEVYAPNFNTGERVVLVRFPHGGRFEIPELSVNNNNPAGKKLLGPAAKDAIGIHPKVAERLSGADFDGDTVLVIPNDHGKILTKPALEGLRKFDPKESYPPYPGMRKMTPHEKGMQMGLVSNLITDMTIRGATDDELARAVRHSMVVIDAEKHNLDYRRSAQDNGISALMKKYQNSSQGGASTLISRATSPLKVNERKERPASKGGAIDPATGKKVYEETGRSRTWTDADGKTHTVFSKTTSTKLAEADDAHSLSSGTLIETIYADHSNKLKALGNQARKASVTIKSRPYVPSARRAHAKEYESLTAKVALALQNAPRERQAQIIATGVVRLKVQANPALREKENKAEYKRVKSQALAAARIRTGADKQRFEITDAEWAAIQAGAVTSHKLDQILTYADLDRIKELATPTVKKTVAPAKLSKAKAMLKQGYTWAEIAQSLGLPASTIQGAISTEEGD